MTTVLADGTDAAIIARSLSDADAFGLLYDRHAAHLYRFAQRRLGPEVAQDVLADTFLAAFGRRERYDLDREDARPWLYGILVREIAQHHRKEMARLRGLARYAPDVPVDGPADRVAAHVTAQAARRSLAAALAALNRGERDVLLLFAWCDLSYDEISAGLGIPVGTVRSRLSRARSKVRILLGSDPALATDDFEE